MARRNREKLVLPEQPDSFEPADWWMYCDMLQDAGARPALWRRAKRVGDSLERCRELLLLEVYLWESGNIASVRIPRENAPLSGNTWGWFKPSEAVKTVLLVPAARTRFLAEATESCLIKPHSNGGMAQGTLDLVKFALKTNGQEAFRREFFDCHGRTGAPVFIPWRGA